MHPAMDSANWPQYTHNIYRRSPPLSDKHITKLKQIAQISIITEYYRSFPTLILCLHFYTLHFVPDDLKLPRWRIKLVIFCILQAKYCTAPHWKDNRGINCKWKAEEPLRLPGHGNTIHAAEGYPQTCRHASCKYVTKPALRLRMKLYWTVFLLWGT